MVDLETLGNGPDAVIMSAAVVAFDGSGWTSSVLSRNLTIGLNQPKRTQNSETLNWWMAPEREKKFLELSRASLNSKVSLRDALLSINKFIEYHVTCEGTKENNFATTTWDQGSTIWCKSTAFDLAILRHAYAQYDIKMPYPFRAERDVRTVIETIAGKDIKRQDTDLHNPLADAEYQIKQIVYANSLSTSNFLKNDKRNS